MPLKIKSKVLTHDKKSLMVTITPTLGSMFVHSKDKSKNVVVVCLLFLCLLSKTFSKDLFLYLVSESLTGPHSNSLTPSGSETLPDQSVTRLQDSISEVLPISDSLTR